MNKSPLPNRYSREDIQQFYLSVIGRYTDSHHQIIGIYRMVDIAEPSWLVHVRVTPTFTVCYPVFVQNGTLAICRIEDM